MHRKTRNVSRFRALLIRLLAPLLVAHAGASWAAQTVIPPPANPWAARFVYVLDKDTNSVFINANPLFISSLQPLFPAIQSVTNLTGHDDFYLYPDDQAKKFRADDARVIAGGTMLVTDELNQPVGGVRTVVRVIKVPLRDAMGNIFGLRAIWFNLPQLTCSKSGTAVELSYPGEASIFRLEQKNDLEPGSFWTPQTTFSNALTGRLNYGVSIPASQSFFRLAADRVVKIGALLSLSGNWSTLGQNCQAAIQISVENFNIEQFSSGSPLYFQAEVRDTALDPATALAQLQSLAAAGVHVVLGPQSSAELRVLKPFADSNGILLISPSSTASSLAVTNDNVFRFCPDDTYEAAAMVTLLKEDGVQAVVPAWRDDAGNQGLHDSVATLFPAQGGTVYPGVRYSATESNFTSAIAELSSQVALATNQYPGRVAIYLAAFDEVAGLFNQARSNSLLASVRWYGSDGVVQSVALASDTNAAAFAATHGYPCPTFGMDDRFRSTWEPLAFRIKTKSGVDVDAFTLAAYDSLQVAAAAYRAVGSDAPVETIKAAFIQSAASYTGATGSTRLTPAGDRDGGAFDFWSLKPGTNGYVWYRSASYEPGTGSAGRITRYSP